MTKKFTGHGSGSPAAPARSVVVLHHGWMHEGDTEFHYTIDPPSYPALATDMVFAEDGHDVLVASALGAGDGTMTLGPGEFFRDPAAPHTVRMRINQGWGWWLGSTLVPMGMAHEPQGLPVVDISIEDVLTDPEGDPNPILGDGECPESVLEGEFDVKKCGPAKVEYQVTSSLCDASVDAARFEVEYDPGNEAHRDFYDLMPDDFMVSMEADPDPTLGDTGAYEFEWDGRDDTDDERILLGGKFLVKVEADLTVTGDGWSEAVTEADSIRQEIAKPHASNYGINYGPLGDNFGLFAGTIAAGYQQNLNDGSGFAASADPDVSVSRFLEKFKRKDAITNYRGHSSSGLLIFGKLGHYRLLFSDRATRDWCDTDEDCPDLLKQSDEVEILSEELVADDELEDVHLVVLMGCGTGLSEPGSATFADILIGHGVDIVISVPGNLNKSVGTQWERFFWPLLTQRETLPMDPEIYYNDPEYDSLDLDLRGAPATIRNTALAAAFKALDHGNYVTREDQLIMRQLLIESSQAGAGAIDEFVTPARYGSASAGKNGGGNTP